jgi:perosamine synthetase
VDHHETIGYNFKFTDLQAVVGIEQMKKLPWRVTWKREMFRLYRDQLADTNEVEFLPTDLSETTPWFMDALVPDPAALRKHLKEHGIGSRPFYPAIHSQPAYGQRGSCPNSEYAADHGLWLPSSSFLTDDQIQGICETIRSFYRR